MSLNEKRAWGNVTVWGAYLISIAAIFTANGSFFFWQSEVMKNAFYLFTGVAVAGWFVMMSFIWFRRPKKAITADERDNQIMFRVNAVAGPLAMTAVAVLCLILAIAYVENAASTMSPYFLFLITMTNVVAYWLSQAIITLIAYRRS